MMRRYEELVPYDDCPEDTNLGMLPLAVGWLMRKRKFPTGKVSANFMTKLAGHCSAENTVCPTPACRPCPLCNERVMLGEHQLGGGEIRVLGEEEIYAAPNLIYHFVEKHSYLPPEEFIDAVVNGPSSKSDEHRALINAYHYFASSGA